MNKWLGYPVVEWKHGSEVADFSKQIFRISSDYRVNAHSDLTSAVLAFLECDGVEGCPGIVLGDFGDPAELIDSTAALIEHRDKLPNLRALYLGEADYQISWINQGPLKPIIEAFPGLEDLRIRGSEDLTWEPCRHICLQKLIIVTGGIDRSVLQGILNSVLPELEHLEIWLGTEGYGWDGSAADVKGFLYQNPFPKLKYLGLTNCDQQTEIAQLAADAPVLDQLETLDLSMGTLTDPGGEALLQSGKIKQLKHLNLNHHYMSDEMVQRFQSSGLNVNVDGQEEPDTDEWNGKTTTYYYVQVGE